RPLDLGGEIGRGPEAIRTRQRVGDPAQGQRLRREDLADAVGRVVVQLPERGRVEGSRRDARRAERLEPRPQLARRLVRERHGEDLTGAERAGLHLHGDPVRDRGRLPGARAREDADGPAHGLDRAALLGVQLHPLSLGRSEDGAPASVQQMCERAAMRAPHIKGWTFVALCFFFIAFGTGVVVDNVFRLPRKSAPLRERGVPATAAFAGWRGLGDDRAPWLTLVYEGHRRTWQYPNDSRQF